VDPDPHGSAFILVGWVWIRIRIRIETNTVKVSSVLDRIASTFKTIEIYMGQRNAGLALNKESPDTDDQRVMSVSRHIYKTSGDERSGDERKRRAMTTFALDSSFLISLFYCSCGTLTNTAEQL
jgi:hypothetical protein